MSTSAQGAAITKQLQQYETLKEGTIDFIFDAEGELATAFERFSAKQLLRWSNPKLSGLDRNSLTMDLFITEGSVAGESVIQHYLQADGSKLEPVAQDQISQWTKGFMGLFEVQATIDSENAPKEYTLKNWLTEKSYSTYANTLQSAEITKRVKKGEIVLALLVPLGEQAWTFSGPITVLGKLGKPKLAVAIGNFKKWFPEQLYGNAPDLKEAAWESVKQQYDDFIEIFGETPVTLPGRELNEKLQAYQQESTAKQLAAAGIDSNQSLQDMAKEAGLSAEEVSDAIAAVGEENKVAQALLSSKQSLKMVMPKVQLPDDLRQANAVTVFSHPRWGQTFLADYQKFDGLLQTAQAERTEEILNELQAYTLKYLENEQANAHVWQHIRTVHGKAIEPLIRTVANQPNFDIDQDLAALLMGYDKPMEPTLPESASVPIHLHNLFQEAMKAVGKTAGEPSNKKKKKAKKKSSGFGS
ncbi:MAG: hypothetical protein AAGM27_00255 [Cyanobacteria bacterium J06554_3]